MRFFQVGHFAGVQIPNCLTHWFNVGRGGDTSEIHLFVLFFSDQRQGRTPQTSVVSGKNGSARPFLG